MPPSGPSTLNSVRATAAKPTATSTAVRRSRSEPRRPARRGAGIAPRLAGVGVARLRAPRRSRRRRRPRTAPRSRPRTPRRTSRPRRRRRSPGPGCRRTPTGPGGGSIALLEVHGGALHRPAGRRRPPGLRVGPRGRCPAGAAGRGARGWPGGRAHRRLGPGGRRRRLLAPAGVGLEPGPVVVRPLAGIAAVHVGYLLRGRPRPVGQLGGLGPPLHRDDRGALDRVGVVVGPEREAQGRAGPLRRRLGRAVAEAGLVVTEPVADVVALQRLGRLVGAEQTHALGGIAVALVAAVVPIGHVVILSSGRPPSCTRGPRGWWQSRRGHARGGGRSVLEQLLLLVLERHVDLGLLLRG